MDRISERIAKLSLERQQLLRSLLKQEGLAAPPKPITARAQETNAYPLSSAQQRLWFLDQFEPGSPLYNITNGVRIAGGFDLSAFSHSIAETVRRHEVLRTIFSSTDGQPVQVIRPRVDLALPLIDLSEFSEDRREAEVRRLSLSDARVPFDLSQGPLLRVTLFRLSEKEHFVTLTMHHIISDAWSSAILIQELSVLYNAFSKGTRPTLPDLPIQYADYAIWQREMLEGESLKSDLAYWQQQLTGAPGVLELPTDRPRPSVQTFRGASQSFALSPNLSSLLQELSRRHEATLFVTLLAALQTLLYRYSGQEDFCVGTPVAGRTRIETESLIGFFINTLVVRANLSGNPSFSELLDRVRETVLEAQAHQEVPFEELVEKLQPERSLSHTPLFQVMFTLQNAPRETTRLEGLALTASGVNSGTARFDLNIEMGEGGGRIIGSISYNTDLFDSATITRLIGHFQTLLEGLVTDPDRLISSLNMLTPAEQHRILVEWNNTRKDYPFERSIDQVYEAQVEQRPDDVAIVCGHEQLTYGSLNERANQLAHYLVNLGVGPEMCVGVCMERSLDTIVALLGIVKAGAAYVPLDPTYPLGRLAVMLEDSAIAVLLTQERLLDVLPTHWAHVVCLDTEWEEIAKENTDNPPRRASADNLAYVMYTSGSTGKPKGVAVAHRAVLRLVINNFYADLSPDQVLLQFAPVAFDASTFEIWGSLLNGARLVLVEDQTPSLEQLGQSLKAHGVTTLWLTAGLFHLMVEERLADLSGLNQLLAGGDVLSARHVRRVLNQVGTCQVINGYGPTEATTFSCCNVLTSGDEVGVGVAIGGPIANTRVYVVDGVQGVVPVGVEGELLIGGDGLARGYLGDAVQTAEKFVPDNYGEAAGERLYRTGDRVRWAGDGKVEFVGRRDRQVKVRGYRIEMAEVERALGEQAGVAEAVVEMRGEGVEKRLVGYVVKAAGTGVSAEEMREGLRLRLPEHMVPGVIVELERLPLNANGKVDRQALPGLEEARATLDKQYVPPRNSIEFSLAAKVAELLKVDRVGVFDSFFDLGGHSLLATQLVSRVSHEFHVSLPLRKFFEAPTVADLTVAILQMQVEQNDEDEIARILAEMEDLSDEDVRSIATDTTTESPVTRDAKA